MKSVESMMIEWSAKLPEWERFLLYKIISQEEINDEVIDSAYKLLKNEHGLSADKINPIELSTPCVNSENPSGFSKTIISKISGIKNINALVEGECIEINPQLTIIYGGNGSGKSGYARVLADAGFTRGDHAVLRNVTTNSSSESKSIQSVKFTVNIDGNEKTITHEIGQECPELRNFYVFDSTSVKVHLSDQNEFSFSPMGMEYFLELAESTDRVRALLSKEIESKQVGLPIVQYLSGKSEQSKFISTLTEKTTFDELEEFCSFTEAQERKLVQIPVEIANLSDEKIKNQINDLQSIIATINLLIDKNRKIHNLLCDEYIGNINQTIENFQLLDSKTAKLEEIQSKYQKSSDKMKWVEFVQASFSLSKEMQDHSYPEIGDNCLLCQRPLDSKSVNFIKEIWQYVSYLENVGYEEARKNIQSQLELINSITIPTDDIDYPLLANYLSQKDTVTLESFINNFSILNQRKTRALECLKEKKTIDQLIPIQDCEDQLADLLSKLGLELREIELTIPETRINELIDLQNSLSDRNILNKNKDCIRNYLENLKWISCASKIGGSTKHITDAQNQVFKQLVTDEYLSIFNESLQKLERSLQVKVSTSGKKGKTVKQIVINQDNSNSKFKPDTVLSEGEKRMVALIDFLTEVQLDGDSSGIVFDDPVTSLDVEWKELIAKLIFDQSTQKQVIVFTHDLHLLYLLKEFAKDSAVSHCIHWIKRSDTDNSPGHVFLNNSPASERDYINGNLAENHYNKSLTLVGNAQYNELKLGFGAIRSSYEALVIFELLGNVVQRFNEQISIGRLKDIRWDERIVKEIENNFGRVSRYIDAHLHSDSISVTSITPDKLQEEIRSYRTIRSEIKALKKKK
jgi:energy-coupling factor transporter ATP-binding protein EcfA2